MADNGAVAGTAAHLEPVSVGKALDNATMTGLHKRFWLLAGLGIMLNIATNRRSHIGGAQPVRRQQSRTVKDPRRTTTSGRSARTSGQF